LVFNESSSNKGNATGEEVGKNNRSLTTDHFNRAADTLQRKRDTCKPITQLHKENLSFTGQSQSLSEQWLRLLLTCSHHYRAQLQKVKNIVVAFDMILMQCDRVVLISNHVVVLRLFDVSGIYLEGGYNITCALQLL